MLACGTAGSSTFTPPFLPLTPRKGEVALLSELLLQQPGACGQRDARGWLPLHRAAVQPVPEVLQTVLRGQWVSGWCLRRG